MLDKFEWKGNRVKNYFLISNFFKEDEKETDSLNYLRNDIKPEKICFLPKDLNHKERGDAIKNFLVKNKIDFVVAQLCPSTIYALFHHCRKLISRLLHVYSWPWIWRYYLLSYLRSDFQIQI